MTAASIANTARPETLAWLIARHVRRTPEAIAILAPGRTPLTFARLGQQMTRIAEMLATAGFGNGSRVAIALGNGPEAAVAVLGITSAATCVPLNPESDAETLRLLCRRLRIDAIIVGADEAGRVRDVASELAVPTARLSFSPRDPAGAFVLEWESARGPVRASAAGPDDIALVLHTSGTTGRPKVVPLTQRGQYEATLHRVPLFRLTAQDRGLCVTPIFTASAIRRSLFPPLAVGGSIVCISRFDAERMLDWLTEFSPTFYAASPAVHRAVLEAIERRGAAPRHALRFVISGSTPLPEAVRVDFEAWLGVPVIQTYAMTESGAIAQNRLPPGIRQAGSVGTPTQGEVAILGDDGRFLEAGESGEIVVRGPQVFRGYEDDPEATRQAFFGDWFRTGDLGYRQSDGSLYVTGRANEIINRGGFKVPPAEVDAALVRHPDVAEAATFAVPHPTLGEDVVAAVVLREGATLALQQLRDFAFDTLAGFKVPSRIVLVACIPRTPLGKLRRSELASVLTEAARPAYDPPQDSHEAIVAELFAEVLGLQSVGSADKFFTLGGDSLRSTQVVARANARFDCGLEPTTLFRRPTVAEFAGEIRAGIRSGNSPAAPPIAALPRGRANIV